MYYVYLLKSLSFPSQSYIGLTSDLKERLNKHNAGGSPHSSKYMPWKIVSYFAFGEKEKAVSFEQYLKTQAGRVFAQKRLW